MGHLPAKLKKELLEDPFYRVCARKGLHGHECEGRITLEHAIIYAGSQVQKKWAIIPLCAKAHAVDEFQDGGDLNKGINKWIAYNRATDNELLEISKATDYFQERSRLNKAYGQYTVSVAVESGIRYPWLTEPEVDYI